MSGWPLPPPASWSPPSPSPCRAGARPRRRSSSGSRRWPRRRPPPDVRAALRLRPMITSRPEIVGTFGVVATTHWLATTTGMTILERGGNAFDAAVAAGFVLHVVEPDQNGPGGDLPVVLWSAARGRVDVVCGQGVAPAAADVDLLLAHGLDLMPGTGHLPAVVPGSFGAWMLLLRDYGTMTPRDVLEPAITIARDGFVLKPAVAALIGSLQRHFQRHWPSSAEVYLPGGRAPAGDALYALPAQAATYERILREAEMAGPDREAQIEAARRAWYEGFVAEAIDGFFRTPVMDTTGEAHAGLLTGQDLATWRATGGGPPPYRSRGPTRRQA